MFHSGVVVGVLLTSCVKAISYPTHSLPPSVETDGPFKEEKHKTEVTVASGLPRLLLLLHESPSDVQTTTLQERLTSRDMQYNNMDSELKMYYCEKKEGILFSLLRHLNI